MDPESGLDAVRNVGIRNGKVAAIATEPLEARQSLDVSGLVVAPGFIDLHAHGQDLFSSSLQARDGVTTALELEMGVFPVDAWYASKRGRALIHYGATVGHVPARIAIKHGIEVGYYSSYSTTRNRALSQTDGAWAYEPATVNELRQLAALIEGELNRGALGIGLAVQYTPGASREEIRAMYRIAAKRRVVCFIHTRYMSQIGPGSSIEGIQEVISDATITGAATHVFHIASSALNQLPACLDMIERARAGGLDITTEMYPYTAASTDLSSAMFNEGWQQRLGIFYNDLEWAATGKRLNAVTFRRYRALGGPVIIHMMHPARIRQAIAHPMVMIASDGMPFVNGRAHPRGAGTFSRVLGHCVRELQLLSLMNALRKMTLMPAQRLERSVPQMRHKGRIKVGADADITVFDPLRVSDRATFASPARGSAGIEHVLVAGVFVVKNEHLIENVYPGQAIRGTAAMRAPARR